ncbi:MAG: glycerol-3-phosphate acyltransferase [Xanthobacteraceae bacterium]
MRCLLLGCAFAFGYLLAFDSFRADPDAARRHHGPARSAPGSHRRNHAGTGRKGLAALTLVFDALKGTVAALIAYRYGGQDLAVLAALGAFLGHLFPVWLKFKGGKGVATYLGLLIFRLACSSRIRGDLAATAVITQDSSVAALVASAATPVILWYGVLLQEAKLFALFAVLIWLKHFGNIRRLISGQEGKIGRGRQPAGDAD